MKRILVTGAHRSGTTWVGKVLSANKDVAYFHEPFNVKHCRDLFGLPLTYWFSYIPDIENQEQFYRLYERILVFETHREYPSSYSWNAALRCRIRDYLQRLVNKLRASTVVIKDPIALLSAEHLAYTYDMRVVCMIRHPLAFCGSIKRWHWEFPFGHFTSQPRLIEDRFHEYKRMIEAAAATVDQDIVDQAILLWNLFHDVIRKYKNLHPDWIFLRHEDVVRSPLATFRETYEKLGLDFSHHAERAIMESLKRSNEDAHDPSFQARDRQTLLKTWKDRLTETEVDAVERNTVVLREYFYPDEQWKSVEPE